MTPSQTLLLHASTWAGPTETHASQIAEMLLAAAFLANEAARSLELELFTNDRQEKVLTIHPGEDVPDWPAHSLEFQVWQLMARGGSCVADIVYDLIKENPAPAHQVVHFAQAGLLHGEQPPLAPVSQMLQRTSQERPALWAELFAEIRTGLATCQM